MNLSNIVTSPESIRQFLIASLKSYDEQVPTEGVNVNNERNRQIILLKRRMKSCET